MATVRYTTVNGRVIAEKRGGVRKLYRPDHLGSTIAMYDNTQAKTDTWVYWPYGAVRTRTGTTATPFQFVGALTAEAATVGGDPSFGKIYVYDQENRMTLDRDLIGVGLPRYTMTYDGDGQRRSLLLGSTKTTFIWDGTYYLQGRTS